MKSDSFETFVRVFGQEKAEALASDFEANEPDFANLLAEVAMDRIWSRSGLPLREKSLITLSSQVALGRWDQVKLHMASFLHLGGTEQDLRNMLIHLALYCGFPAAVAGLRILKELKNEGILKAPQV